MRQVHEVLEEREMCPVAERQNTACVESPEHAAIRADDRPQGGREYRKLVVFLQCGPKTVQQRGRELHELLVKIQNNSILPPTSSVAQHRVHDFWYAQHAL